MEQCFRKVFIDEKEESHKMDIGIEQLLQDLKTNVLSFEQNVRSRMSHGKLNTWNPALSDEDEWE